MQCRQWHPAAFQQHRIARHSMHAALAGGREPSPESTRPPSSSSPGFPRRCRWPQHCCRCHHLVQQLEGAACQSRPMRPAREQEQEQGAGVSVQCRSNTICMQPCCCCSRAHRSTSSPVLATRAWALGLACPGNTRMRADTAVEAAHLDEVRSQLLQAVEQLQQRLPGGRHLACSEVVGCRMQDVKRRRALLAER